MRRQTPISEKWRSESVALSPLAGGGAGPAATDSAQSGDEAEQSGAQWSLCGGSGAAWSREEEWGTERVGEVWSAESPNGPTIWSDRRDISLHKGATRGLSATCRLPRHGDMSPGLIERSLSIDCTRLRQVRRLSADRHRRQLVHSSPFQC